MNPMANHRPSSMSVLTALSDALGEAVLCEPQQTEPFRRDYWVRSEIDEWRGSPLPNPMAVVTPTTTQQVASVVQICQEFGTPVITRGAGSGVVGGVLAQEDGIVLSTHKLITPSSIDKKNLLATFGAGTNGLEAEELVQDHGLTIGHWPQSIGVSSVGGWVATRASGQFSTAYGNIEDILYSLVAVLPDGSIYRSRETPRAAAGPDLRQLFLGSEGTLGVITEVTFSLRTQAPDQAKQAFHFDRFDDGLEAIRRIMAARWLPPVVRLYDPRESRRNFAESVPKGRSVLIFLHEGPPGSAQLESAAIATTCANLGGVLTESTAVEHWFEHRNTVPTWTELFEQGLLVDTIEVATKWSNLSGLYRGVVEAVSAIPSVISMTAHSSHAYRSGANLYFTAVAAPPEGADYTEIYDQIWDAAMTAADSLGAGLAHHHGIGRVRRTWLNSELGESGSQLLSAIKAALDPKGLFNPGVLMEPTQL